jgi:xanthine/uracil permease
MKSASIILGLAIGCLISGLTGYWSVSNIRAAPPITFLWVHTFKLSVDGALILPLLIMFICEAVSCMPDILATAEISNVDIEGTQFNSRIQGGILCDGLGSLISAFGTGLPMVSQAGNNGVISLTGCASRRAGWCASGFLILMGMFGKFGAVFGSMVCTLTPQYLTMMLMITASLRPRRDASLPLLHHCRCRYPSPRPHLLDTP